MQSLRKPLGPSRSAELEEATRTQSKCPLWHAARRVRLTASKFGVLLHRRPTTKPDALVNSIIYPRTLQTAAMKRGIAVEPRALQCYVELMKAKGRNVKVEQCGFVVSPEYSFLGVSPDAFVTDPLEEEPLGIWENKSPLIREKVPAHQSQVIYPRRFTISAFDATRREHVAVGMLYVAMVSSLFINVSQSPTSCCGLPSK